jgi:NADH-quinone oxidoreductase subunit A
MNVLLGEYLPILIFIVVATGLAAIMVIASLIVARQKPDSEKLSPYECGFEAFDDARRQFDVRFYLVSILFIIFDLEVAFLFPWAVSLGDIGMFGFNVRLLVDDDLPRRAHRGVYLRVEKGRAGVGVTIWRMPSNT